MLISNNAQKILKIIHLVTVCCWMGGAAALMLLLYASTNAQSGDELFGILKSYRFVNIIITVYIGAYGSFFTGLAYSVCTNRGFFRHRWIILKWLMTLAMLVGGMQYLGPRSGMMMDSVVASGAAVLHDPEYIRMYEFQMYAFAGYMLLFLFAVILSVYKPWEKEEALAQYAKAGEQPEDSP